MTQEFSDTSRMFHCSNQQPVVIEQSRYGTRLGSDIAMDLGLLVFVRVSHLNPAISYTRTTCHTAPVPIATRSLEGHAKSGHHGLYV
jgi:hypothetical protein